MKMILSKTETKNILQKLHNSRKRYRNHSVSDIRLDEKKYNSHPKTSLYHCMDRRLCRTSTRNYPSSFNVFKEGNRASLVFIPDEYYSLIEHFLPDHIPYFAEIHSKQGHSFASITDRNDIDTYLRDTEPQHLTRTDYLISSNQIFSQSYYVGDCFEQMYSEDEYNPDNDYMEEFKFSLKLDQLVTVEDNTEWKEKFSIDYMKGYYKTVPTQHESEDTKPIVTNDVVDFIVTEQTDILRFEKESDMIQQFRQVA